MMFYEDDGDDVDEVGEVKDEDDGDDVDEVGEGKDGDDGDDVDEVGEGDAGGGRPKPMVSGQQGGMSPGQTLLVTLCLPYRYYTDIYFIKCHIDTLVTRYPYSGNIFIDTYI